MSDKKIQLFCIPFAGGSSRSFDGLAKSIDESIEVVSIAYPGRGVRANEPFFDTYEELVADTKRQILDQRDTFVPFALLGYSMGSAVAYDLLQRELYEKPIHTFICARESLDWQIESKRFALLDEESFTAHVQRLGGIDERIASNPRFLKAYIRPVYADYKLWHQHRYCPDKGMPNVDLTVFYSENDTPRSKVQTWKNLTSGSVDLYEFGENHFFIFKHASEMGKIISDKLMGKAVDR